MIGNMFTIVSLPVPHLSLNVYGECEGWGMIKNKLDFNLKKKLAVGSRVRILITWKKMAKR